MVVSIASGNFTSKKRCTVSSWSKEESSRWTTASFLSTAAPERPIEKFLVSFLCRTPVLKSSIPTSREILWMILTLLVSYLWSQMPQSMSVLSLISTLAPSWSTRSQRTMWSSPQTSSCLVKQLVFSSRVSHRSHKFKETRSDSASAQPSSHLSMLMLI